MLLNRKTGLTVCLLPDGRSIQLSNHIVGTVDPAALRISPGLRLYDSDIHSRFEEQQRETTTGNRIMQIGQADRIVKKQIKRHIA